MQVVTVASNVSEPFLRELLVPSCAALDLELVILKPRRWESFVTKWQAILSYLGGLPPDQLVLFTDAYDAFFAKGQDYIVDTYRRLGHEILFSGEANCWPLGVFGMVLYRDHHVEGAPHPYLNSGGFIGPAGALIEIQKTYPEPPSSRFDLIQCVRAQGFDPDEAYRWSDQYRWTLIYLLESQRIGLDVHGEMFECLAPYVPNMEFYAAMRRVQDFELKDKKSAEYLWERVRVTEFLGAPRRAAQIHLPGTIGPHVVLEMWKTGALPAWVRPIIAAGSEKHYEPRVVEL